MDASNYPPGVTGCEPEIIGDTLQCPSCGEDLDIDYKPIATAECHKCKKLWPLSYLEPDTFHFNTPEIIKEGG